MIIFPKLSQNSIRAIMVTFHIFVYLPFICKFLHIKYWSCNQNDLWHTWGRNMRKWTELILVAIILGSYKTQCIWTIWFFLWNCNDVIFDKGCVYIITEYGEMQWLMTFMDREVAAKVQRQKESPESK